MFVTATVPAIPATPPAVEFVLIFKSITESADTLAESAVIFPVLLNNSEVTVLFKTLTFTEAPAAILPADIEPASLFNVSESVALTVNAPVVVMLLFPASIFAVVSFSITLTSVLTAAPNQPAPITLLLP